MRWDNIVQETPHNFRLIDLESVIKCGSEPLPPFPTAWGEAGQALDAGRVTVQTDLYMLGRMMEAAGVSDEEGVDLLQQLLAKRISSCADAMRHPWFNS